MRTVWVLVMLAMTSPPSVDAKIFSTPEACNAALYAANVPGLSRAFCLEKALPHTGRCKLPVGRQYPEQHLKDCD